MDKIISSDLGLGLRDDAEPTLLGKKLYPPNGYYFPDTKESPCTCDGDLCGGYCAGKCGCAACYDSHQDAIPL